MRVVYQSSAPSRFAPSSRIAWRSGPLSAPTWATVRWADCAGADATGPAGGGLAALGPQAASSRPVSTTPTRARPGADRSRRIGPPWDSLAPPAGDGLAPAGLPSRNAAYPPPTPPAADMDPDGWSPVYALARAVSTLRAARRRGDGGHVLDDPLGHRTARSRGGS